jgi:methanogenic corrinoid protein MtbC1
METLHPIRVVAQRTGLSPDILRAWERRYGVVEPVRAEAGPRLYTDEDVERLRLLRLVVEEGRSIGRVSGLSLGELEALVEEDERHRAEAGRERLAAADEGAAEHVRSALEAVSAMDPVRLDSVLVQAALGLGSAPFLERVAVPLMGEVGERWHAGTLGVAHEHLATATVERVLGWLTWSWPEKRGPVVVVATPSRQRHELGARLCAAVAAEMGWRVVYLGSEVPATELARSADQRGARLVALSAVFPPGDVAVGEQIRVLGRLLPEGVGLVVGGAAAPSYLESIREAGGLVVPDLAGLRRVLEELGGMAAVSAEAD